MTSRFLVLAFLVACTDSSTDADMDLAAGEAAQVDKADGPTDWDVAPTLHAGARASDGATIGGRRIHPLWIAGSPSAPVAIDLDVQGAEGYDVRVAVLGPLVNGTRAVLAADGYASRKHALHVHLASPLSGEHLVVIGSFGLQRATAYDVIARCSSDCGDAVDILATPKTGALVATETDRLVQLQLGAVLADRDFDVEVELWISPPGQPWNATQIGTSVASGSQVNAILPAEVAAGDDITLVVREAGGRVLDTGVVTRFAPVAQAFARTDAVLYGDLARVQIAGVVGFFEGTAELALRSETYHREIAQYVAHADAPGAAGIGFGAFDATFDPASPNLPHDGELLSVGYIAGNGDYRRLGCFEYAGGPRACP